MIYATNAIESINAQLYKIIKTRGQLPSDEAATKRIWLPLRNITADWGLPAHNKEAMNQFATSAKSGSKTFGEPKGVGGNFSVERPLLSLNRSFVDHVENQGVDDSSHSRLATPGPT